MEPLHPGNLHENIESVIVTFSDTYEVHPLTTREGSANHFFPRFSVGEDDIQLRLDWSDLDSHGQPTLDSDFLDRKTGKHRTLKGKRREAHHTKASLSDDRVYEWEFDGFSRPFRVAVNWRASVSEVAHASDYCSSEVISGANGKPEHG